MRLLRICCALAAIVLSSTPALAQGGANSSLTGVVVDGAGGVIPGATVTVKNNATGSTFESVSNTAGAFSIPALDPGTYTVTVSLDGFKTAVISDVRLLASTPGSIRVTLEVGDAHRDGRGQGRHRARADAVHDGDVDDHDRADHEPAARLAQRALLRRLPARRRDRRRAARLDDQRPAAEHDQHHDRRRQREQQLPVDRRLLLDGHAAARRGRGGDGDRRDAGRRAGGARARCRSRSSPAPAPTSSTAASTTTSATRTSTRTTTSTR